MRYRLGAKKSPPLPSSASTSIFAWAHIPPACGFGLRLAYPRTIDPDILIIDEVLGAGDASFLKKAESRLVNLIQRSRILVLASHSTTLAQRFCSRALWLDSGAIRDDGPVAKVVGNYLSAVS